AEVRKRRVAPAQSDGAIEAAEGKAAKASEGKAEPKAAAKPAAKPEPTPSRPRPLLLVAAIGAVVAIGAVAYLTNGHATQGQDIEEIELDAVPSAPELLRVRVVRRYPHDTRAFTQGLLWHNGHLYESTGLRGRSSLRKVALESGEVLERRD